MALALTEKQFNKMGEVLAFENLLVDTFSKGHDALLDVMEESEITDEYKSKAGKYAVMVQEYAEKFGGWDVVSAKAEKTFEKLSKMRDMYIGDSWDEAAEVLEWMGFQEGAAVVHWGLIEKVAEQVNNEELNGFANEVATFHHDLLHRVKEAITV